MRKRIQDLSLGKVREEKPEIRFSETNIALTVLEGGVKSGFFTVRSINGVPFRGLLSSSNPRVDCGETVIQGDAVKVPFEVDAAHLSDGDVVEGEFLLAANLGEYVLPYRFCVKKRFFCIHGETVSSLDGFVEAAKTDFVEAAKCFKDSSFEQLFSEEQEKERLLAAAFREGNHARMDLEEFFVALGRKQRISLRVEEETQFFEDIGETRKARLSFTKSTWGYTEFMLSSTAGFIRLLKSNYTGADFVGNRCSVDYLINEEKLHTGYNFGEIAVKTPYGTMKIPVTVHQRAKKKRGSGYPVKLHMLREYIDFRLGRRVKGEWVKSLFEDVPKLALEGEEKWFYWLMQTQALIINRQRQDALQRLREFVKQYPKGETPNWAYYLYLTTLLEREPLIIRKTVNEIKSIYKKNPKSRLCFWVLLYLDTDYEDEAYKLMEMERQCLDGFVSPVLYLESFQTIQKRPTLLTKLGKFEIQLLNWMRKEKLLNRDIMESVILLLPKVSRYDGVLVKVLEESYFLFPDVPVLDALVLYLLRGRVVSRQAWEWYGRAIGQGLAPNSLYEAYVMCMEDFSGQELPEEVLRYFAFDSRLPEKKKAQIYLYVIDRKEQFPDLYEKYRPVIRNFAVRNLKQGRVDDVFAELYEKACTREMLDEVLSEQFVKLLFTVKVTFFLPGAVKAYVYQETLQKTNVCQIYENMAYLSLYPGKSVIVCEDAYGRRFGLESDYEVRRLMNRGKMMAVLEEQMKNTLPFELMHVMTAPPQHLEVRELAHLAQAEPLRSSYRNKIINKLLETCVREKREKDLAAEIDGIPWEGLGKKGEEQFFEIACKNQDWKKAYEVLSVCGIGVDRFRQGLADVVADAVLNRYGDEKALVFLAVKAVEYGCESETVLGYVCEKYCGRLEQMVALWEKSVKAGVDAYYLAERILIRMMYCGMLPPQAERVFEQYEIGNGNAKVIDAYQVYMSYHFLRGEVETPQKLAGRLQLMCGQDDALPPLCRRAALKSLALAQEWDSAAFQNMDNLLKEALINNEYYSFYRQLPEKLKQKYLLDHLSVVEYVGERNDQVRIGFLVDGVYRVWDLAATCADTYAFPLFLTGQESRAYYLQVVRGRSMELSAGTVTARDTAAAENTTENAATSPEAAGTGDATAAPHIAAAENTTENAATSPEAASTGDATAAPHIAAAENTTENAATSPEAASTGDATAVPQNSAAVPPRAEGLEAMQLLLQEGNVLKLKEELKKYLVLDEKIQEDFSLL